MLPDFPRVLIGTLYAGENEFDACLNSVRSQDYNHQEHMVIRNLPNREAHEALYGAFMAESSRFDLFVKLDADMVFMYDDALTQIVAKFREIPDLDHLEIPVQDVPSGLNIWGLHAFSNRATWVVHDQLFVDAPPLIPGRHIRTREERVVASHCSDPDPVQAFILGVHRAAKVVQSDKTWRTFDPINSISQYRYLSAVWRRFQATRAPASGICVFGAELYWTGSVRPETFANKARAEVPQLPTTIEEFDSKLQSHWGNYVVRIARFANLVGSRFLPSILLRSARRVGLANSRSHLSTLDL